MTNQELTSIIRRTCFDFDELTEQVAHNDDIIYWQQRCYEAFVDMINKVREPIQVAKLLSITYCLSRRTYEEQGTQQILDEISKEAYGLLNKQFDACLRIKLPYVDNKHIKQLIHMLLCSTKPDSILTALAGLLNQALITYILCQDY